MNGELVVVGGTNVLYGGGAPAVWPVSLVEKKGGWSIVNNLKKSIPLPDGCVSRVTMADKEFDIVEWPAVIELDFGVVKVTFVGNYAWDAFTHSPAYFACDPARFVKTDEFELINIKALVDAISGGDSSTSPAFDPEILNRGPEDPIVRSESPEYTPGWNEEMYQAQLAELVRKDGERDAMLKEMRFTQEEMLRVVKEGMTSRVLIQEGGRLKKKEVQSPASVSYERKARIAEEWEREAREHGARGITVENGVVKVASFRVLDPVEVENEGSGGQVRIESKEESRRRASRTGLVRDQPNVSPVTLVANKARRYMREEEEDEIL